jgi:hypothetical protein
MNKLQEYLTNANVTDKRVTVKLGKKDGNSRLSDYDFTIRPITSEEYNNANTIAVKQVGKERKFNASLFNIEIITQACVEPDFKALDFIEANNVRNSRELIRKTLLPGEITQLAEYILQISGFNYEVDEEIDEIKNS